jgi:hypothetical protein
MNVKPLIIVSALATICSGLLFVVVALWIPGILHKPGGSSMDAADTTDLAALKQSYSLLKEDSSISQNLEIYWVRIAALISVVVLAINTTLFALIFSKSKTLRAVTGPKDLQ